MLSYFSQIEQSNIYDWFRTAYGGTFSDQHVQERLQADDRPILVLDNFSKEAQEAMRILNADCPWIALPDEVEHLPGIAQCHR